ncbi:hypothetical protein V492_03148 [Pseudogymnoascus sp. VKM F-4246]|nr:hypothetical protein V492_03148 [Pseudogymnoascus sp. VKM F-4246]
MMGYFLKLLVVCSFVVPLVSLASRVGAPVKTTSGTITGQPARDRAEVSEYLGIRYAHPPTGTRRFQPPVALHSEEAVDAFDYSPACPFTSSPPLAYPDKSATFDRIYGKFLGGGNKTFSEDCLSLNIWAKNPVPAKLKPVVFFIHGGRFAIGTANITHYDGQYVADTGEAVMVSINYRMHVLGFSGAPGLTQNTGILDQRMALEWVRDNIKAFGGDPKRIMLYGQSVGGLSADYHAYAWPDDPIAAGIFSMSGTAASVQAQTLDMSSQYWYNLSRIVGCPVVGNAVPCMQKQSWQTLLAGVRRLSYAPTLAIFQPQFQETADEVTVFSDYAGRGRAGKFAKVPYLVGNGDHEAGFYKLTAFATGRRLIEKQWDIFNLQGFTCASRISAENRLRHGVTTYRYRYFGDWANLRLYPGSGAYHGADLNMWHGVGQDVSGEPNSESEDKTSAYMMKALIAFATDPEDGLSNMGWPKYADPASDKMTHDLYTKAPLFLIPLSDSSPKTLVRLGYNNETEASFSSPDVYDLPCLAFNGDTKHPVDDNVPD